MHYLMEVVMPPTDDIKGALEEILKDYYEGDEENADKAFFDWWQIGGRYSGAKLEAVYPKARMDEFCAELKARKVTVSSFCAGKQTLQPESQIPMVDALWRDFFPDSPLKVCPLFTHSGEQLEGDVMRVSDLPENTNAFRFMVAAPNHDGTALEATYMLAKDIWNGTNHQKTDWDGSVIGGIKQYADMLKNYTETYRESASIRPDWICVTVDYHT